MLTAAERKQLAELTAWRVSMERRGITFAGDLRQGDVVLWPGETQARGVLAVEPGSWGVHPCMREADWSRCVYCEQAAGWVAVTMTAAFDAAELQQVDRSKRIEIVSRATPERVEQARERLAAVRARADQQRAELRELFALRNQAWGMP